MEKKSSLGHPQPKVGKSQEVSVIGSMKIFSSKGQKTVGEEGWGVDSTPGPDRVKYLCILLGKVIFSIPKDNLVYPA